MLAHHIVYAVFDWANNRVHTGTLFNCIAWTKRPAHVGEAWTIAVWKW